MAGKGDTHQSKHQGMLNKGMCLSGILEEARGLRAPFPEKPCRCGSFLPWASLHLQTLHMQRGQKFGLFCAILGSGMASLWGHTWMCWHAGD